MKTKSSSNAHEQIFFESGPPISKCLKFSTPNDAIMEDNMMYFQRGMWYDMIMRYDSTNRYVKNAQYAIISGDTYRRMK